MITILMISNNADENMTKQYRYRKKKNETKENNKKPLKDCEEKCEYYNKENKLRLH